MSTVTKCDRCGKIINKREKFVGEDNPDIKTIDGRPVLGIQLFTCGPCKDLDLCYECVNGLYDFLDGGAKDESKDI